MIKFTSFTALLLLLCFASFLSDGLSRPFAPDAAIVEEDWWFHGGFAYPPMPAGGFKWPHKKWPFVPGPMPAHGKWPFAKPPFPCPWWPKIGFVDVGVAAKQIDGAAAPPPAA